MDIVQHVKNKINSLFPSKPFFVLGVSGGQDSVVLGEILHQLEIPFAVAHVNYGLRGEDSDLDEQFVATCAEKWNTSYQVYHAKRHITAGNIQAQARLIRRKFFFQQKSIHHANAVVMAQHLDDQWETQWLRMLRGSVNGLGGMHTFKDQVFRPLLDIPKNEIHDFAIKNQITWREDLSNTKDDYARNFLRLHILPVLKREFQVSPQQIIDHTDLIQKTTEWNHIMTQQFLQKHLYLDGPFECLHWHVIPPHASPLPVLFHWLHDTGFTPQEVREIAQWQHNTETGAHRSNANFTVWKERNAWVLEKHDLVRRADSFTLTPECPQFSWNNESYEQDTVSIHAFMLDKNPETLQWDADVISGPILLRPWENGDKWTPLGMNGVVKISDFLTQRKCPTYRKKIQNVVLYNNTIIGVEKLGIAEFGKITSSTQRVRIIRPAL